LSEQERHQQQEIVAVNESPRKKNGKKKALIIGISKYDHNNKFQDLEFCENDANEVYNILKDQGYDIPANAMLVGREEWSKMRDEIIKFFTDRTLKPEDTLFFYFSGRGYLDRNTGRTYLSTSETHPERPQSRGIPFDELTTYLNLSCSERIIAVLDCCYSGALEVHSEGKEAEDEYMKAEKGEEIASLANTNMARTVERLIKSEQGKCVLASSLEEQSAFGMKDQPYSLFTYFLIQGLKGANGESVDINGYVTTELLGSYVNKKILELDTIKQKPIRKIDTTSQIILAYYPDLANRQQQQQASQKDYLLQLLKEGKIDEFNEFRRKNNYSRLDFYNVDLGNRDLSHADLGNSDLNLANLREAKLQHTIFVEASLIAAQLSKADLSSTKLSKSRLLKADLAFANLSKAKLSRAILTFANLSAANLSAANLSFASLLCADLSFAYLKGAKLSFANLSAANLSNADLLEADLSAANLSFASLSNANLSKVKLSKANLSEANLSNAYLSNAKLSKANLSKANLSNADLSNAKLSKANLSNADLSNAKLSNAYLSNAKLSFARLSNADLLEADLSNAKLLRVNLSNANLSNADLLEANLTGANLTGAKLLEANLSNTNLTGANLTGANLTGANLTGAKLLEANLSNTNLTGADLTGANLTGANLTGANLTGANLTGAKLLEANLSNTNLTGADLTGANLTGADLTSSIIIGVEFNEDYPECKNANFDGATIIDDEILSRHFHNSNSKNVPPAVKDKNELISKLVERGFDRGGIDLYFLPHSYLPGSSR
jgi:uncharacterized protein YjbI with pentapeptide repeats